MKRWIVRIMTAFSAVLCLTAMIFWGDSYRWGRSVQHERFLKEGRPWILRTMAITSAEGSIEFWWMKEHIYLAKNTRVPGGFSSISGSEVPQVRNIRTGRGWVHEFAGFGIGKGWDVEPAVGEKLVIIAALAQGIFGQKTGWVESLYAVWIPYWAVVLVSALLPIRQLQLLIRRQKRQQAGKCLGCGYDLRGSAETCPECGKVNSKATGEAPVPQVESQSREAR